MTVPAPHTWTAGDDATSANLQSNTDAIEFLQDPPRARAYQSVSQNLTDATGAVVSMTSESVDTDGIHSTAVNTSRMTIVTPGRYRVVAQVGFVANATGYRMVQILKNGTIIAGTRLPAAAVVSHLQQCADEVLCIAGDYIEMQATQTSGGTLATSTGENTTFLHVVWAGIS